LSSLALETHRKYTREHRHVRKEANCAYSILQEHGIDVVVNLPFVGENLQDQTTTDMFYTNNNSTNFTGLAGFAAYLDVDDVFGDELASFNASIANSIKHYAERTANVSGIVDRAVTEKLFRMQYDLIFKNRIPISEIIVSPAATGPITVEYWGLLPFSRGSIHIDSSNASAPAQINPNYFMLDYDIHQQIATAKMARKFANTAPFSEALSGEVTPGLDILPANASDADWEKWLKSTCKSAATDLLEANFRLTRMQRYRSLQLPLHSYSRHDAARNWRCGRLQSHGLRHQQRPRRRCLYCAIPGLRSPDFHTVRYCRESSRYDQSSI
jgi:choline dehydrogenase-like flavoprotein